MHSDVVAIQAPVSSIVSAATPAPTVDMLQERRRATFSVEKLADHLNGGRSQIEKRQKLGLELSKTPWADKSRRYFLTREEEYVGALKAATGIWMKMAFEKDFSVADALLVRSMVDFPGGLELHIGMFIPTIQGQGTAEQQAELLPKCRTLEIIGTYAQTELGHGTFVRGLETTATYVPAREAFVIHSPTLTSTKWWPGGLGKTATHAVVMARLFIGTKDHGPHPFIVQLRDLATHRCLPGIEVGDIGPKFGYQGVDNGFLRFDHVVVPRKAMLMKFAKVLKSGEYVPPPPDNLKASYSTMIFVRADIVRLASKYLAKAAAIAVRYCAVRRQTASKPGHQETQLLDYENVAATLLPLVAAAYVAHYMGQTMWAQYEAYEHDREQGRFENLPQLHALSSGMKAITTTATADGIEACRRSCGGHGYSLLSGLPTLYASYVQNCTWEGDNNVLYLQTARYLVKAAATVLQGQQPVQGCEYLALLPQLPHHRCAVRTASDWSSASAQEDALSHRAARLAAKALKDLSGASADASDAGEPRRTSTPGAAAMSQGEITNGCTTSLIKLARAHCELALLQNFRTCVTRARADVGPSGAAVLQQLGDLWCCALMQRELGDFLEDGYMSSAQAGFVHQRTRALLQELRPNAVPLVDAWAFTDYELNSCLGREDGDVYNALLAAAKSSPLNVTDEGPAWTTVIQPAIERLRSRL